MLRSHSRVGRSESTQSVENIPERRCGAPRPELEMAQPEMGGDVSCARRDARDVSDSPGIDSSGETVKTLSGPSFPDRQKPEMEILFRPSFLYSSSTAPQAPSESFTFIVIQYWHANISAMPKN